MACRAIQSRTNYPALAKANHRDFPDFKQKNDRKDVNRIEFEVLLETEKNMYLLFMSAHSIELNTYAHYVMIQIFKFM